MNCRLLDSHISVKQELRIKKWDCVYTVVHQITGMAPQKKDLFRRQGEGRRIGLGDRILAALAVLSGSF